MTVLTACVQKNAVVPCDPSDLSGCPIEDVDVVGNRAVDESEIEERIATAESSHPLGGALEKVPVLGLLDHLTVDYEHFDRFVLERDLARIERLYRSKGFYEARVRAARVTKRDDGSVRVEIAVTEGPPVDVGKVDLEWKDWRLPMAAEVTQPVTEAKNTLAIGQRFEEEKYEETKNRILRAMTDRGFAYASVQSHVDVDLVTHQAHVVFTIELGPKATFGDITFEGLGEIPEDIVRDAIEIEPGEEFSTSKLESAEYALADFGVFSTINVVPKLSPPGQPRNTVVPVVFKVQPAALRAVQFGVGAEVGQRVENHFRAGWENRNLLGGLRRFNVELRPGFVFYPLRFGNLFDEVPEQILPEVRFNFALRQPLEQLDPRTRLIFSGDFRLAQDRKTSTAEAEDVDYILGYRTYSGAFGPERPFWNTQVYLGEFIGVQLNEPFSYNDVDLPASFDSIVVPYLETDFSLDLRRNAAGKLDKISPSYGIYLEDHVQFAGGFLGGDADDIRIQPQLRGYVPISRKVTLALRVMTGVLFARNYGELLADDRPARARINPTRDDPFGLENAFARETELLRFRGFFSGGPYSNRGYPFNGISPHAWVCSTGCDIGSFQRGETEYTLKAIGGQAMWEASAEVRIPISGNFGTAVFVDASDVTRAILFRLTHPHLSAGAGLRYQTPVGALRFDIGIRIPCAQVIDTGGDANGSGCQDLPPEDITVDDTRGVLDDGPQSDFLGLPMAVSIAIGEAF